MRENYHAARWDEPLVMELGAPGRRGCDRRRQPDDEATAPIAGARGHAPRGAARRCPSCPSTTCCATTCTSPRRRSACSASRLFGTCTVKYNPRVSEQLVARPQIAELHPYQDPSTLQGVLEIVYRLDRILREVSGMDQFVFQPGGGANAAYTHACVTRAYHQSRGELETRREVITTIQSHPCNPATAAAAGFDVITLPLEEHGYPSLEALKAAVSERTAALMVGNPDDMGIYNPEIKEWVRVVHEAGGLAFYDHANFNGVMGRLRAREIGFDACMYMLHKTFGAPKTGGGGPADGRLRLQRRAGGVPAGAAGRVRRRAVHAARSTGRSRSARSASSWATCRSWCGPTRGRAAWARTASPRRPTCPCSPTTTWRPA